MQREFHSFLSHINEIKSRKSEFVRKHYQIHFLLLIATNQDPRCPSKSIIEGVVLIP
jgi:hypothetical protein